MLEKCLVKTGAFRNKVNILQEGFPLSLLRSLFRNHFIQKTTLMDKVSHTTTKRFSRCAIAAAFAFFGSATQSFAQLTLTGTSYTQSFDGVASGLPTGWSVYTGASATTLGAAAAFSTTAVAWATTTGQFANMAASEAPATSGDATAAQSGRADRVIGLRQSSAFGDGNAAFALRLANTTGFSTFTMSFKLQSMDPGAAARTQTWLVDYGIGTAPTSFTTVTTTPASLSTAVGTWNSTTVTLTLPAAIDNQSGNVWIRVRAAAATTGSGNRPVTGLDDVTLSWGTGTGGCATPEPTVQASSVAFSATSCTGTTLSWTNGDGTSRIVVASLSSVAGSPADLSAYTANPAFGAGSTIAAGEYVVYNGTGSTVTVAGLSATTTYYFKIFEYNGAGTCQNYLTSGTPVSGSVTTIVCPATVCPHLTGALINACNGSCQEGDNEILFFNSGTYSIPVTAANIAVKYGTTNPATTNFTSTITSNASFVANLNSAAGCGTLFYDAVTAGTIPAGSSFLVLRSTACYGYDFSSFCGAGPVYVIFSSSTNWAAGGNFANSGTAGSLRYFRTDFSNTAAGCVTDYSYEPNLLTTGGDGDQVTFPANGGAADQYLNSGSCNASLIVLPIELVDLSAAADGDAARISWTTASETNNDYFTLEHSTDAVNFTPVAKIKGAGNSTNTLHYGYTDAAPAGGINYYRLAQSDFNGDVSRSGIVSVTMQGTFLENVYPNPATDQLNIRLEAAEGSRATFEVTDLRGMQLFTSENMDSAEGIYHISINALPAGTYILKSRINDRLKQTLFIKQ